LRRIIYHSHFRYFHKRVFQTIIPSSFCLGLGSTRNWYKLVQFVFYKNIVHTNFPTGFFWEIHILSFFLNHTFQTFSRFSFSLFYIWKDVIILGWYFGECDDCFFFFDILKGCDNFFFFFFFYGGRWIFTIGGSIKIIFWCGVLFFFFFVFFKGVIIFFFFFDIEGVRWYFTKGGAIQMIFWWIYNFYFGKSRIVN